MTSPVPDRITILAGPGVPQAMDVPRSRAVLELLALATTVYEAYQTFSAPQQPPIPEALQNIQSSISAVNQKVDAIVAQLASLAAELRRLEERITGHIDEALLRTALGRARGIADALRNYMTSQPVFEANQDQVRSLCDNMQAELNGALANTRGGLAGLTAISPGFSVWARAYMMLYRVKAAGTWPRIWETTFHRQIVGMFMNLFQTNRRISVDYNNELNMMPGYWQVFRLANGTFVKLDSAEMSHCYPSEHGSQYFGNFFTPRYSPDGRDDHLETVARSRCRIEGITGPVLVPGYRWADARNPNGGFENPALVAEANAHFAGISDRRRFILEYFALMRDAERYEAEIRECSEDPAA